MELIHMDGVQPEIVLYLEQPPSAARICELATLMGVPVADLLRKNETEFREAGDLPALDDDQALAEWIERNPRVLQRPIVYDDEKIAAVVGRPPENVEALLS